MNPSLFCLLMTCPFPSLLSTPMTSLTLTDVDLIYSWATQNYLTFNARKCKYMLLSRKCYSLLSSVTINLQLGPNELERVSSYRYLGVIITDNLTWDEHISHMCAEARRLIGLFFRRFAKFLTPTVLIKLYKVLIRPHLEYCPYVWDPFTIKLKQQIESVQKFALRVCLKHWDMPYSDMLELTGLPTLESRRSLLKLCLTFKIVHGLVYFLYSVSTTRSSSRLSHSLSFRPYSNSSS